MSAPAPDLTLPDWPVEVPSAPPAEDEIQIWCARLDASEDLESICEATLSPAERFLARRRVTDESRRRAIVSRGLLRYALGHALGVGPADVLIALGEQGKPHLADQAEAARLDFNLSHTGELWLLALVATGPVGIDVETPREETDWNGLTERYFSGAERAAFAALPAERRREAFFRTWTHKEAFLKARGSGLATPLDRFDVEVDPARPAELLATRLPGESPGRWRVLELDGLPVPAATVVPADLEGGWSGRRLALPEAPA